jgi:hypothetical protein
MSGPTENGAFEDDNSNGADKGDSSSALFLSTREPTITWRDLRAYAVAALVVIGIVIRALFTS